MHLRKTEQGFWTSAQEKEILESDDDSVYLEGDPAIPRPPGLVPHITIVTTFPEDYLVDCKYRQRNAHCYLLAVWHDFLAILSIGPIFTFLAHLKALDKTIVQS